MAKCTLESSVIKSDKLKALISQNKVKFMKVDFTVMKRTALESKFIQTEIYIWDNLWMERSMEMVNSIGLVFHLEIQSQMDSSNITKVNGGEVCLMDSECIKKLMVIYIRDRSRMDSNMEKVLNYMEMEITTKVNLWMVCLKDMVNILGKTVTIIRETLSKDYWTVMGFGKQAEDGFNPIKVIIWWIKNQDMEFILGIMVGSIKAIFKTINEMALDSSTKMTIHSNIEAFGRMDNR
jgi:hypothetical protein